MKERERERERESVKKRKRETERERGFVNLLFALVCSCWTSLTVKTQEKEISLRQHYIGSMENFLGSERTYASRLVIFSTGKH